MIENLNQTPNPNRYLLVGLGNPGQQYERTRHNLGWLALDELERRFTPVQSNRNPDAVTSLVYVNDNEFRTLKPQTYMNLSGRAVLKYVQKYQNHTLIVISDDITMTLGSLRFRLNGGAGGHKGLKDIIQRIGTQEFIRIRMGCGPQLGELADFVLRKMMPDEFITAQQMADRVVDKLEQIASKGLQFAISSGFNEIEKKE